MDIYTTLKQKGTENNIYPNVKAQNMPLASSIQSGDTSHVVTADLIYKEFKKASNEFTASDNGDPDESNVVGWNLTASDMDELSDITIVYTNTQSGDDYIIHFNPKTATKVHHSNYEEYVMIAPYNAYRVAVLTFNATALTAQLTSL